MPQDEDGQRVPNVSRLLNLQRGTSGARPPRRRDAPGGAQPSEPAETPAEILKEIDDLNQAIALMTEALIPGLKTLDVVQDYFHEEGEEAAITVAELAARAGVPAGTARRTLQRLVELQVLVVVPGHGPEPDLYRLPSGRNHPRGGTPTRGQDSRSQPSRPLPRRGRPRPDWSERQNASHLQ